MTEQTTDEPGLRIRVVIGPDVMIGPGKAELLERIMSTGSIAAAGREMGMSYKRAWTLVDTMNRLFREPVVDSSRGGSKGGGAVVTDMGQAVLREYRALVDAASRAAEESRGKLSSMLRDMSDGK